MKRSPVSVIVNGERFEVQLETPVQTVAVRTKAETAEPQTRSTAPEPRSEAYEADVAVKAPMPGRIISVLFCKSRRQCRISGWALRP